MKETEIEKRYLITDGKAKEILANNQGVEGVYMIDFYIPNNRNHMDLRLRKKGNEYCITRKTPVEEGVMSETTIEINEREFEELSKGLVNSVCKTRYKVDYLGYKAELDEYDERHKGLIVLEIEFPDKQSYDEFTIEQQEGLEDITGVEEYAAGKLAEIKTL